MNHLPGEVDLRAVREVAAVLEVHGEHGVAGLGERRVGGEVGAARRSAAGGLRARRRRAPWRARCRSPRRGRRLAAAVVALAGIALGVLVRQRRAERGKHRRAGEVLAGDELQPAAQPLELIEHHVGDLRVLLLQRAKSGPQNGVAVGTASRRRSSRRSRFHCSATLPRRPRSPGPTGAPRAGPAPTRAGARSPRRAAWRPCPRSPARPGAARSRSRGRRRRRSGRGLCSARMCRHRPGRTSRRPVRRQVADRRSSTPVPSVEPGQTVRRGSQPRSTWRAPAGSARPARRAPRPVCVARSAASDRAPGL